MEFLAQGDAASEWQSQDLNLSPRSPALDVPGGEILPRTHGRLTRIGGLAPCPQGKVFNNGSLFGALRKEGETGKALGGVGCGGAGGSLFCAKTKSSAGVRTSRPPGDFVPSGRSGNTVLSFP